MKKINFLSMRMVGVYFLLFAMVCAVATFVEKAHSTQVAKEVIYNTHWFELILDVAVLALLYNIVVFKLYKWNKLPIGLFHLAFVFMILGAAITRYVGEEGKVHIREGETVHHYIIQNNQVQRMGILPVGIRLDEFVIDYYPGSQNPSEFKSKVTLFAGGQELGEHEIYMNHILKYEGYRFYQSSYDQDMKGTILSVNHDPWGMGITYFGYALLLLGMILSLFAKGSRFQELLAKLKAYQAVPLMLLFMTLTLTSALKATPVVEKEVADAFGKIWVSNSKGRIQPMNTLNRDLLRKMSKESRYDSQSADQVMLGLMLNPQEWSEEPLVYVDKALVASLGIKGDYISYNELFDPDGSYRLMAMLSMANSKPVQERNKKDKAVLAITERISVFKMVMEGEFMLIYPNADALEAKWESPHNLSYLTFRHLNNEWLDAISTADANRLTAVLETIYKVQQEYGGAAIPTQGHNAIERYYNKLNAFTRLAPAYASVALLLLYLSIVAIVRRRPLKGYQAFKLILIAAFVIHTVALGMRWYISGHAPMSNGYESMLLVSWGAILGGLIFARRSPITLAISTLLAAATLLVAHMNSMNPEITALVPVLDSYWLSSHVSSITTSYGLLAICALLGLFSMSLQAFGRGDYSIVIDELTTISKLLMIVGLYLLTIGCFIGAVWANESWGRYWSWDPKETWCLITIMVYSFIIHMHHVKALAGNMVYNILTVWAISSILMTYFGVNYFLGGMHSYAAGEAFPIPKWILPATLILLIISIKALWGGKNNK